MRSWLTALTLLLSSCGQSDAGRDSDRLSGPTELRSDRGFLVPPDRIVPAGELAAAVRSAGYPCDSVTEFSQLEIEGKALDNYKLDCGSHSYLLTWLEHGSRIKPWNEGMWRK